ncbi:MAG TPA: histidine--tRNA ligase [Chitinophagaceae bacterium]|jgi:histidyl-tRNA synthetase|nr:histidine--tRNA ligase [Chitinophagaceae bacterium]
MSKPTLPQGTRDFGPDVVRKRSYILNTIKSVFELYGFQPLETPAMENLDTLMGKYGEEGDKLIFRILDSGNSFSINFFTELFEGMQFVVKKYNSLSEKQAKEEFGIDKFEHIELDSTRPKLLAVIANHLVTDPSVSSVFLPKFKSEIASKALKYDLTIPFARYVAMNHNQLTFPFKRYQVQPVWRADRPQKGRYREFYQCDADVVGSKSLLNEVELSLIYHEVFTRLGLTGYELRINHRKILAALAEACGGADKMTDITIAIDKLDKIGIEKVKEELAQRGLSSEQVAIIEKYLSISGNNEEILTALSKLIGETGNGKEGLNDLRYLLTTNHSPFTIDPTLARGLNYYTGVIFEAKAPATVKIGSIGGGGRYDDLTGLFGVPNIPGVGISFGVDRIYDVMEELKLFPADVHIGTQVLFFNLGENESAKAFELVQELRQKGIRSELYHEATKFDKQFKYAEKKNIPFVVIIGNNELQAGTCNIKNIITGQQQTIQQSELYNFIHQ